MIKVLIRLQQVKEKPFSTVETSNRRSFLTKGSPPNQLSLDTSYFKQLNMWMYLAWGAICDCEDLQVGPQGHTKVKGGALSRIPVNPLRTRVERRDNTTGGTSPNTPTKCILIILLSIIIISLSPSYFHRGPPSEVHLRCPVTNRNISVTLLLCQRIRIFPAITLYHLSTV